MECIICGYYIDAYDLDDMTFDQKKEMCDHTKRFHPREYNESMKKVDEIIKIFDEVVTTILNAGEKWRS